MTKNNASRWKLSRPALTAIQICISIIFLFLIYIAVGCPAFTPETQFRRLEKSHLIGPSVILGTEVFSDTGNQKLIIAEDGSNAILYRYNDGAVITSTELMRQQKTGSLTVLVACEGGPSSAINYPAKLPVILFDDYPQAIKAELIVEPVMIPDEKIQHKRYSAMALRETDGYFLFRIDWKYYTDTSELPNILAKLLYSPATIRLYDRHDQLILEQELEYLVNPL